MAPRLESAVLTRPDIHIWLCINLPLKRPAPQPLPSVAYLAADRRDAALMWNRARFQQQCTDLRVPPMPARLYWGVLVAGAQV